MRLRSILFILTLMIMIPVTGITGSSQENMTDVLSEDALSYPPYQAGPPVTGALRSLPDRGFLPDGTEFLTWEPETYIFTHTYVVNQAHPDASDTNPGTAERPFLTISQAAHVLQPGERVVVESGTYREWVSPARGGTDPQHMISYEAAPGANVIIKGSDILDAEWIDTGIQSTTAGYPDTETRKVWMARLPRELFIGYNPFACINYPQVNEIGFWDMKTVFAHHGSLLLLRSCGLVFQDGRPLEQADTQSDLMGKEGAFRADMNGLTLYITTFGDINPNEAVWEITTREQVFAPDEQELHYIRVKGFTMEHAGNGFPFPQRGLLSATLGTHWVIEDNIIRWANSIGVDIGMQGTRMAADYGHQIVRRNTISDCGICGIAGAPLRNSLIEDNLLCRNAWLDTEWMAECAAMKFHWCVDLLIRRNLIIDVPHGAGIYADCQNQNVRISRNTVIGCGSMNTNAPGPGHGAIYLEATSGPAMVDHNIIWGSTKTNGIYGYYGGHTVIAHNLIGQCAAGGIVMVDESGRPEGNLGGGMNIQNNILVNNGWNIDLYGKLNNASDYNLFGGTAGPEAALKVWESDAENVIAVLKEKRMSLYSKWSHYDFKAAGGAFNLLKNEKQLTFAQWQDNGMDTHSTEANITAELNPDTLELTWAAEGLLPACLPADSFLYADDMDEENELSGRYTVLPGPFRLIPQTPVTVSVDPRKPDRQ